MTKFMNVGQLKEYLSTISDDTPIVVYRSDIEKSGYMEGLWVECTSMKKQTETTVDAFDYSPYEYEVYVKAAASGIPCLMVN